MRKEKMTLYKLMFFIVVICLMSFIIINSFEYEEFKGRSGEGYSVGFTFSAEAILAIVILISIPGYFVLKRLNKN
jgi:hypothetical protein